MGHKKVLAFGVRTDLRTIVMKRYSTFPKFQICSLPIKCSLVSYPSLNVFLNVFDTQPPPSKTFITKNVGYWFAIRTI